MSNHDPIKRATVDKFKPKPQKKRKSSNILLLTIKFTTIPFP